jgi:hypothetical protein
MTLRCPVCRAENAGGSSCRRCRADLSLVAAIEDRRAYHIAAAATDIRNGFFDNALMQLQQAEQLRLGRDIDRTRACVQLVAGDFTNAIAEHAAASRPE